MSHLNLISVMPKHLMRTIPSWIYKVVQRMIVLDVTRLLWFDGKSEPTPAAVSEDYSIRLLSLDEVQRYSHKNEHGFDQSSIDRLSTGSHFCCAAEDSDGLASYIWLALGSIEAQYNRGAHPDSGVALSFSKDTAFVYQAFTRLDSRGRGLFPACMRHAREKLSLHGVSRLLSTTDWSNASALRSFQRAGFRDLGLIWRFGCRQKMFTITPSEAKKHDIYFNSRPIHKSTAC